jgi:hypothetical protein
LAGAGDLFGSLSSSIRKRMDSAGRYVAEVVADEEADFTSTHRLSRRQLEALQLVCTAWMLDRLLQEGTHAARAAVDELRDSGVDGFSIGSDEFRGRNENVERGALLSDALRRSIGEPELFSRMDQARGVRRAIVVAYREARRA